MPTRAALAPLLAALLLTALPSGASQDGAGGSTIDVSALVAPTEARKKVLLIGIDGIRVDILEQADTPNLDALITTGAFSADARTRPITVSGPGWSSMLTGVWMEKHGVESNDFTGNHYAEYPDFLTRIEQVRPELNTYAVIHWPAMGTTADGGPMISRIVDVLVNINGDAIGYVTADAEVVSIATHYLRVGDPDATFVYMTNTDSVAHETSSLSPEYRAAIELADQRVGELVAAVQARPTYAQEDWLILSSTDHGRTDEGDHGDNSIEERTIYYLVSGPSADPAALTATPHIVDIVPTALAHLGIEVDPGWDLAGQVNGLTPTSGAR